MSSNPAAVLSGLANPSDYSGHRRVNAEPSGRSIDQILATCASCGGRAYVEELTITTADGQTVERWTVCAARKPSKYGKHKRPACPVKKEVIRDMGVISEALKGVNLQKVADKLGKPWQAITRHKWMEDSGREVDPQFVSSIVAATDELRAAQPEPQTCQRRMESCPVAAVENPAKLSEVFGVNRILNEMEAQDRAAEPSDVFELLRQFRQLGDRIVSTDPDGRRLIAALSSKWGADERL